MGKTKACAHRFCAYLRHNIPLLKKVLYFERDLRKNPSNGIIK